MILVDTSVWVEHLRRGRVELSQLLAAEQVMCHPFVVGELACGNLRNRDEVLLLLSELTSAPLAGHVEVLALVENRQLLGRGIGWIDAHLLGSTLLADAALWTVDRRLAHAARSLGVLWAP
jgi:predicted nucleic acid-binding protein